MWNMISQKQKHSEFEEWLCEYETLNNTSVTSQGMLITTTILPCFKTCSIVKASIWLDY